MFFSPNAVLPAVAPRNVAMLYAMLLAYPQAARRSDHFQKLGEPSPKWSYYVTTLPLISGGEIKKNLNYA
jgi:hypothetical protein